MYLNRTVCVSTSGVLHKVCLRRGTNQLRFDEGPWLELPWPMIDVQLCANGEAAVAGVVTQNGQGHIVLRDSTDHGDWPTVGEGGLHVRANAGLVEVYVSRIDRSGVDVFRVSGDRIRGYDWPAGSKSVVMHHIAPDGSPVMMTDYAVLNRTVNGLALSLVDESGGFLLGGTDIGNPPHPAVVRVNPDGSVWEFPINSQVPWRIAAGLNPQTGQPDVWCAISGEETPEPDAVPFTLVTTQAPHPGPITLPPSADAQCQQEKSALEKEVEAWQTIAGKHVQSINVLRVQNTALTNENEKLRADNASLQREHNRVMAVLNRLPGWLRRAVSL